MFRTAIFRNARLLSTSARLQKTPVEVGKDMLKKVDRVAADAAVKGIETGEKVVGAAKSAAGVVQEKTPDSTSEAQGKASELAGEAKGKLNEYTGQGSGKSSEVAGEAKGKASELAGEAKGKAQEYAGQAKGTAEQVKRRNS
ncbi:hypothetical protein EJ06DRAFT_522242 [Trichodelitschia bisporula]|uniref:LEA domain-containing protein n=1 Tax=Trichodelitschia bisporula TaxID=703511 RepID=A0A6G1HVM3_9PEZI|nr:hypothetical protein EJ06DRAFT_522242 [Trichodelitschia bisporula]